MDFDARLGETLGEHVAALLDDGAQVDGGGLVPASAREVQQRVHDAGGAEGLALDLAQQAPARIPFGSFGEQHLGVARDAGQRRVHLVGDAGGHGADRRQALVLGQFLLHRFAFGDVEGDNDPMTGDGAQELGDRQLHVLLAPLRVLKPDLDGRGALLREELERDQVVEGLTLEVAPGEPDQGREGDVRGHDAACGVDDGDAGGGGLDDLVAELLEFGDAVQLPPALFQQLRVLDRQRRLVQQLANQRKVVAGQRCAAGVVTDVQEADPAIAHLQREDVVITEDRQPHRGALRGVGERRRREQEVGLAPDQSVHVAEFEGGRFRFFSDRDELVSLDQEQVAVLQVQPLFELLQHDRGEPAEIPFVEQFFAQTLQGAPALLRPVLEPLEARADGLPYRDREGADDQESAGVEEAPCYDHVRGHAATDEQAEQGEPEHGQQHGERVGRDIAGDNGHVPEPVAQQGVGEAQRHQRQGRRGGDAQPGGRRELKGEGHDVKQQERQVAAGDAERDPLGLAALFPTVAGQQAATEDPGRRQRIGDEQDEFDAVLQLQGGCVQPAGEHAAAEDLVELHHQERHGRQVEPGRRAAQPAGARPLREHEEEVQRQRRQQEAADAVDQVEDAVDAVVGGGRRQQVDGGRCQRPEVEEQDRPAALPAQCVEADQQVGDPGQGERDVGPVQSHPGQAVPGRDQFVVPKHLQVALAAAAQQPVQLVGGQRPFAVDQDDDVADLEVGGLVRRRHPQSAVGRLGHQADRLEGSHLAADGEPAQADDQNGQQEQRRSEAESGWSGLDAHRGSRGSRCVASSPQAGPQATVLGADSVSRKHVLCHRAPTLAP